MTRRKHRRLRRLINRAARQYRWHTRSWLSVARLRIEFSKRPAAAITWGQR